MTDQDVVHVECYSGHTYAQEPRVVQWQGQRYTVAQIESRWRTPEGPAFCVGVESGERFELLYHEHQARWLIRVPPETKEPGARQAKILPFSLHTVRPGGPQITDEEVRD